MHSKNFERALLITGASTGIGNAAAIRFDKLGFKVYAGVRSEEDVLKLKEISRTITAIILDVTLEEDILRTKALLESELSEIGLFSLINNAGIAIVGPLECITPEQLKKQFDVNVLGTARMIKTLLPLLRIAQGRIINISSTSAIIALPFASVYAASKFALEGLSDALRTEFRPFGVFVSLIEPGSVKTPIWGKYEKELDQLLNTMNGEAQSFYSQNLLSQQAFIKNISTKGISPDLVIKTIEKAMTTNKPKPRYLVGPSAKAQWFFKTILTTKWLDYLKYKAIMK